MHRFLPLVSALGLLAVPAAACAHADRPVGSPDAVDPAAPLTVQIRWLPADVERWVGSIERAASRHRVDPDLVAIIVLVESAGVADAKSPYGALGLMQLMPGTALRVAKARGDVDFRSERLLDPAYNLDLGVEHLADLIDTLAPDGAPDDDAIALVAAAYNGGLERALAHVRGEPLSKETGRYVARVLQLWHARAQPRR